MASRWSEGAAGDMKEYQNPITTPQPSIISPKRKGVFERYFHASEVLAYLSMPTQQIIPSLHAFEGVGWAWTPPQNPFVNKYACYANESPGYMRSSALWGLTAGSEVAQDVSREHRPLQTCEVCCSTQTRSLRVVFQLLGERQFMSPVQFHFHGKEGSLETL
jgi:hypothetical protein